VKEGDCVTLRAIIVIGGSAGAIGGLLALVRELPADLPAAIFVVIHVPSGGVSRLPQILTRAGNLFAAHAKDGEAIEHGRIYVAPPERHLLVRRGRIELSRGRGTTTPDRRSTRCFGPPRGPTVTARSASSSPGRCTTVRPGCWR
jgi:chemotaxis response regulator CheB